MEIVKCFRSTHKVEQTPEGWQITCIADDSAAAWTGQSAEGSVDFVSIDAASTAREALVRAGYKPVEM